MAGNDVIHGADDNLPPSEEDEEAVLCIRDAQFILLPSGEIRCRRARATGNDAGMTVGR